MGWLDPVKDGETPGQGRELSFFISERVQPVREGALLRRSSSQTVLMKMWLRHVVPKDLAFSFVPLFVFVILLVATIGLTLALSIQQRRAGCAILSVLVGISWL